MKKEENKERGGSLQGLEPQYCPYEAQETNPGTSFCHGWQAETGRRIWGHSGYMEALDPGPSCASRPNVLVGKEQTWNSAVPSLLPVCCDSDPSLFCSPGIVRLPQQCSWVKGFTLTRVLRGTLHTTRPQRCVSGISYALIHLSSRSPAPLRMC